jgi:sensor histidine kinase YesM
LLVDDDPANIEVLKLILQQDYRLLTAFNGESALEILERRHVDLMIADLIMPGMSGIELTRRVRQRNPALSVPIIIATAHALDSQMQLAYQAGATDYVAKPFGPGEIRKRVQLLLQLSATMEAALGHERAFLAAQIKPHFLYNALNNIIALCYEEPERAAELLALLSRHLRRMFQQESVAHTVSLRQELDMVNAYIEIEKLRFEERLLFVVDFDPGLPLESQHVKTLLIQPLVENAVCHGIFNKLGAGTVTLRLKRLPEHLQIVVEDDGVGMKPEQVDLLLAGQADRGVGLTNVRRRIDAIRGASFELRSKVGSGTTCILKLPLE